MNFRKGVWIVLFLLMIFLLSCGVETNTPIEDKLMTEGTSTIVVNSFGTQMTIAINATQTPFSIPTSLATLIPSEAASSAKISTLMPRAIQTIPNVREYFFDSLNGNDSAAGTSPSTAWKSLSKMNRFEFQPGDIINLKSGSLWTGGLIISQSGTESQFITFSSFGEGEKPIFENPASSSFTDAIEIRGSWIIVENVLVRNAFNSGIEIKQTANNNIIRHIEATDVGIGILVSGRHNLITQNHIHDTKMIINDNDGAGDDYGATGIMIMNGPNEISYNRLINCAAPCYDFGTCGTATEIYLNYGNADGSSFHHNYADNTEEFIEIHSRNLQYSANNVTIHHNVIINNNLLVDIGMPGYGGGHELTSANNIRLENNTYVDATVLPQPEWKNAVFSFHGIAPRPDQVYIRNNIIYAISYWSVDHTGGSFTHTHNIYFFNPQRPSIGFSLDATEKRTAPQFVDIAENDFHLRATSPAINAGANLGYTLDFDNHPIPNDSVIDIGAYQH